MEQWTPPNVALAVEKRNLEIVKSSDGRPFPLVGRPKGQGSFVLSFGKGITLYFRFLSLLAILFLVMFIITGFQLALAVVANNMDRGPESNGLEMTTLGNIFVNQTDLRGDQLREKMTFEFPKWGTLQLRKDFLAWLFPALDLLACFVFVCGGLAFRGKLSKTKKNRNTYSVARFSVMLRDLPGDVTEQEIRTFLQRHGEIVDVTLASYTSAFLNCAKERTSLETKLKILEAKMQKILAGVNAAGHDAELPKNYPSLVSQRGKLYQKIQKLTEDRQREMAKKTVYAAFVSFSSEKSALGCIGDAAAGSCVGSSTLKKIRGHKPTVTAGPEVLNIVWPNLQYGKKSQAARRFATNLVMIFLLLISFGVIIIAKTYGNKIKGTDCTVFFNSNSWCPSFKATKRAHGDWSLDAIWRFIFSEISTHSSDLQGFSDCTGCVCVQGIVDPASDRNSIFRDFCGDVIKQLIPGIVSRLSSVAVIVIINFVLKIVLRFLVSFEKYHLVSEMNSAVAKKIFLAQFVNTALLTLLVNAQIPEVRNWFRAHNSDFILFDGPEPDILNSWYTTVCGAMLLTMMLNALIGIAPVFAILTNKLSLWSTRRSAVCQLELDNAYKGPIFDLSERFGGVLSTMFVCLMFSGTAPLFYLIGAASFFSIYWADKITLLRLYRRPPLLGDNVGRLALSLMPYALIPHLGLSVWGFSAISPRAPVLDSIQKYIDEVYSRAQNSEFAKRFNLGVRLINWASLPMVVFFAVVTVVLIFIKIIFPFLKWGVSCCRSRLTVHILGRTHSLARARRFTETSNPRWIGPKSYSITENPVYRNAFDPALEMVGTFLPEGFVEDENQMDDAAPPDEDEKALEQLDVGDGGEGGDGGDVEDIPMDEGMADGVGHIVLEPLGLDRETRVPSVSAETQDISPPADTQQPNAPTPSKLSETQILVGSDIMPSVSLKEPSSSLTKIENSAASAPAPETQPPSTVASQPQLPPRTEPKPAPQAAQATLALAEVRQQQYSTHNSHSFNEDETYPDDAAQYYPQTHHEPPIHHQPEPQYQPENFYAPPPDLTFPQPFYQTPNFPFQQHSVVTMSEAEADTGFVGTQATAWNHEPTIWERSLYQEQYQPQAAVQLDPSLFLPDNETDYTYTMFG